MIPSARVVFFIFSYEYPSLSQSKYQKHKMIIKAIKKATKKTIKNKKGKTD